MPMTWNADTDQKLFAHFIRIHQVKPDYAALAEAMGSDCTPKALIHRFAKIRSMIPAAGPGGEGEATEGADATPAISNGTDGEAAVTDASPKPAKGSRAKKAAGPRAPRTPKGAKNGDADADADGSPTAATNKRKARATKKKATATTDAGETNGAAEAEDGSGDVEEEEGGSPPKKPKKARAPRKNVKAGKNPNVEIVKREEGNDVGLEEMQFELEGDEANEDSSEEVGGVGIKDEEE